MISELERTGIREYVTEVVTQLSRRLGLSANRNFNVTVSCGPNLPSLPMQRGQVVQSQTTIASQVNEAQQLILTMNMHQSGEMQVHFDYQDLSAPSVRSPGDQLVEDTPAAVVDTDALIDLLSRLIFRYLVPPAAMQ